MMSSKLYGKKILVVDDDGELRDAIVFDLERKGAIVYQASDGREAMEKVTLQVFDIIISDVRMPKASGVEFLKFVRSSKFPMPFFLLATGFTDLSEAEALKIGANGLLEKPIDRKRMLALLEQSAAEYESLCR